MKTNFKFIDHGLMDVNELLEYLPNITDQHWYQWKKRNEPTIPFLFLKNHEPLDNFQLIEKIDQPKWLEDLVIPIGLNLEKKFNGKIIKLMLVAVEPEAINGNYHVDVGDALLKTHRCHIPLIQSDLTRYHVGGEEFTMKVGHCYEKDNSLVHAVVNYEEPRKRRITLQCDVYPLDNCRFTRFPGYYPGE